MPDSEGLLQAVFLGMQREGIVYVEVEAFLT